MTGWIPCILPKPDKPERIATKAQTINVFKENGLEYLFKPLRNLRTCAVRRQKAGSRGAVSFGKKQHTGMLP